MHSTHIEHVPHESEQFAAWHGIHGGLAMVQLLAQGRSASA
jgi:hypothetical protein